MEKVNYDQLIEDQLNKLTHECETWESVRLYVREHYFNKLHEREHFIIENNKYLTDLSAFKNKKLNKISVIFLEDTNEYIVHHYVIDAEIDSNGKFKYNDKWTSIKWFDEVNSYGHEENHKLARKLNIVGFFDIEVDYTR